MAAVQFTTIDGWDSWENQGADVAVASLGGDGSQDLLVLRVDAPPGGPNTASYRVGTNLAADGAVQGWGPWLPIPDWNSVRDDGAGIAVADFGVDGLGLVVLQIRSGADTAANNGRYRIGRRLDAAGQVQGGWSAWQDVPDWQSFRDQGAAVAVADLDGDGRPEIVVFHIDDFHTDNQDLPNRGLYRVGRALTADGTVAGWGDWRPVDWESFFNQGAGVAVADLTGTGRSDLVVFQIDDPQGENTGRYRIGWNVDATGTVQDGWGPWVVLDGWGSWEDAGGGMALVVFAAGQRPRAVVLHVDNPPGLNQARYGVVDLVVDLDQAATLGVWRMLPYPSQVLPVHAALLHTGKVLFFAGSGNNVVRRLSPDFGNEARAVYTSVVWDLDANTFDHPPTLRRPDGSVVDYFCCGHCALPDGRLLVAGGTDQYDKILVDGTVQDAGHGFSGLTDAMVFDPVALSWALVAPMATKRWYPTVLMLQDGLAVATSGLEQGDAVAQDFETIADPDTDAWAPGRAFVLPLYPHLFLLRNGQLIFTGGKMDTEGPSDPLIFDPLLPTPSQPINDLVDADRCNQSASVLLPPAQAQRFMILGGGPEDVDGQPRQTATNRVGIVSPFDQADPRSYRPAAPLARERMHVNAVLLPDRTVLATGGGVRREASQVGGQVAPNQFNEVFEAEIYDPESDAWSSTAPATVARLYHSVALLLPDGRVVTAGGNPDKGRNVDWLPPLDPLEEMRIEIYSPPYLFRFDAADPRPVITDAPAEITYTDPFTIACPRPDRIDTACLIRPGLTTHSFNVEQRLVDLPVVRVAGGLTARLDVDARVAPPGWYLLFLLDDRQVPTVGRWTHLA